MKIPAIHQIREADAYTIKHEPIASIDLMERASKTLCLKICEMFNVNNSIAIVCGMGNNGGDGLALTRMLIERNYKCDVYIVKHASVYSDDCQINLYRLQCVHPECIHEIEKKDDIPVFHQDVIVDSILGSGLNKIVTDNILCALFKQINQSKLYVFSVDIPSGLFADQPMSEDACVVKADFVLTFQFPKLAYLFSESYEYVGEWEVANIDLHPDFIQKMETPYYYIEEKDIQSICKSRGKFSHKGIYGHALIISGSKGMIGAAVLATKACLRGGVGIVEVHVPECGYTILQTAVPEALCLCDVHNEHFTNISFDKLTKVNAIAIGPGIGTHSDTQNGLKNLIYNAKQPIVFDADAINIIAENKTWLEYLPENCIFTPHPKEFQRLVGASKNSFERLKKQQDFSIKYHCIIVLKGAHSSISLPDGNVFFNSTGNPGMATGGSGDVLTGIITGLLAQAYSPSEAAVMGVYLHGKAGDFALQNQSYQSLIASDIIEALGKV